MFVNLTNLAAHYKLNIFDSQLQEFFDGTMVESDIVVLCKRHRSFFIVSTPINTKLQFENSTYSILLTPRIKQGLYVLHQKDVLKHKGHWYMKLEEFKKNPMVLDFNYQSFILPMVA